MDNVGYANVLPKQKFDYYYSQHTRNILKDTFCTNHYYIINYLWQIISPSIF